MNYFNHFVFSASVTSMVSLVSGVYFVSRKSWAKRIFGMFWLAVSFWSFTVAAQHQLLEWFPERVWGWLLHLGCILVPIIFFHFASIYSGRARNLSMTVLAGYGIAFVLLLVDAFTDWLTFGTEYRDFYAYPKPAGLYGIYILFFQAAGVWSTWLLFRLRGAIVNSSRTLLNWFLVLHILAYLGAMDNYLIMYDIRIFPLYPFGLYLVVPYAVVGSILFSKIQNPKMLIT